MPKVIERKRLSYSYDIIDVREINCEELLYHEHSSILYKIKDKQ